MGQGVAQAIDRLEDYRNLLEHRVVARFDTAVGGSDLGSMMACARIMAEFKRGETSLMQVGHNPSIPAASSPLKDCAL